MANDLPIVPTPSLPAVPDVAAWDERATTDWLRSAAPLVKDVRLVVGLALHHLRLICTYDAWKAHVEWFAGLTGVTDRSLRSWREQAEKAYELPPPPIVERLRRPRGRKPLPPPPVVDAKSEEVGGPSGPAEKPLPAQRPAPPEDDDQADDDGPPAAEEEKPEQTEAEDQQKPVQQSFAWSNVEDPREAYQAALVEVEVADDDVLFMLGRYKAGQGAEKMIPLMRKVLAGLLIDHPTPPPSLPVVKSLERRTVTPMFKK